MIRFTCNCVLEMVELEPAPTKRGVSVYIIIEMNLKLGILQQKMTKARLIEPGTWTDSRRN